MRLEHFVRVHVSTWLNETLVSVRCFMHWWFLAGILCSITNTSSLRVALGIA